MNKNPTKLAYVLVTGEYSDFKVVSVWSSEEEARKTAKMLNAGCRYGEYRVETFPLDAINLDKSLGYRATYNFALHGWIVDKVNVVFEEVLYSWPSAPTRISDSEVFVVEDSEEKCLQVLSLYGSGQRVLSS